MWVVVMGDGRRILDRTFVDAVEEMPLFIEYDILPFIRQLRPINLLFVNVAQAPTVTLP